MVEYEFKERFRDFSWWLLEFIFGVVIWKLWDWRNHFVFEDNFSKPSNLVDAVIGVLGKFCVLFDVVFSDNGVRLPSGFGWTRPSVRWTKVNVDGAMCVGSALAGCGGVFRSNTGSWVVGFCKKIRQLQCPHG